MSEKKHHLKIRYRTGFEVALLGSFLLASMIFSVLQYCSDNGAGRSSPDNVPACREFVLAPFLPENRKLDQVIIPETDRVLLHLLVFAAVVIGVSSVLHRPLPPAILNRRRYLFWLWAGSLPFISGDDFIPCYAGRRKA